MKRLAIAFAFVLLLVARPLSGEDKPIDQSSPQSVVKEFKTAFGAKKWERGFQCMTLPSRRMLTSASLLVAGFSTLGDEAKQGELKKLLAKHGLKEDEGGKQVQAMKSTKKLAAIFAEFIGFADKNAKKKPGTKRRSLTTQIVETEFKNFKIDGDRATAEVYRNDEKSNRPADFRKSNGKWYIDLATATKRRKKDRPKR